MEPENPPYTAVIFTNQLVSTPTADAPDGYEAEAIKMERLASNQPGFLGIESVRGSNGLGITNSYWRSEDDARAWKEHGEHLLAQEAGKALWYEWYRVRVAVVEREYSFARDAN
jgi:heme-degrading monooxygenase HmoA